MARYRDAMIQTFTTPFVAFTSIYSLWTLTDFLPENKATGMSTMLRLVTFS